MHTFFNFCFLVLERGQQQGPELQSGIITHFIHRACLLSVSPVRVTHSWSRREAQRRQHIRDESAALTLCVTLSTDKRNIKAGASWYNILLV